MWNARRLRVDTSHADPLVRRLFALIAEHQVALEDLAVRAGVGLTTISRWRSDRAPTVQACRILGPGALEPLQPTSWWPPACMHFGESTAAVPY